MPARKKRNRKSSTGETGEPIIEVSTPKTTRPPASARRAPEPVRSTAQKIKRKLDAVPDRIDVRDLFYQPSLAPLPDQIINCDLVPEILDQGQEGACCGFALAAVINYQLQARNLRRRASPRMLYEMARRYDEWPGEKYEGSSARGGMKGWVAHGVASDVLWPMKLKGAHHLTDQIEDDMLEKVDYRRPRSALEQKPVTIADEAQRTPGGAYYRVDHRRIRDMHSALAQTGILYVTIMVHEGWMEPGPASIDITYVLSGNLLATKLPIITRKGRADGGHAVAVVGYTTDGFIIQNSWGRGWGNGGFALLPYEDWMLHATDCWVAQLGVPMSFDIWDRAGVAAADTTAGLQRAARVVPLSEIRPYVVDIGNNGELSGSGDYWTTEKDLERLYEAIAERTRNWSKHRIMLYLHGGLNDERAVARRIVSFRDVCLENEIYPVHIMWETGFRESLENSILDKFTNKDERAGAEWLRRLRDGILDAKDRTIELTASAPGTALWDEMKENARLSSARDGGMLLLTEYAQKALAQVSAAQRRKWELHVVGHSAGSIFAAYCVDLLIKLGVDFKSLQFMAPAITVDLFKDLLLPHIQAGDCPQPSMYILSDVGERDDTVGPYGKSLLYLVSNAFEQMRETPILGMERFISSESQDPDKSIVDPEMEALFKKNVNGLPSLVVSGRGSSAARISPSLSRSQTHGGFDNDEYTMNSVLYRILGDKPTRPFGMRDLQY